ncbi:MAG: hypothetical protein JWM16_6304, partial [Verrucomicrobiales bacterium]|nr:hypothetical protein [Verrucomicrobiales bacterium]
MDDLAPPIMYQWDGESLVPASNYWRHQADQHMVVGQRYRMVAE